MSEDNKLKMKRRGFLGAAVATGGAVAGGAGLLVAQPLPVAPASWPHHKPRAPKQPPNPATTSHRAISTNTTFSTLAVNLAKSVSSVCHPCVS